MLGRAIVKTLQCDCQLPVQREEAARNRILHDLKHYQLIPDGWNPDSALKHLLSTKGEKARLNRELTQELKRIEKEARLQSVRSLEEFLAEILQQKTVWQKGAAHVLLYVLAELLGCCIGVVTHSQNQDFGLWTAPSGKNLDETNVLFIAVAPRTDVQGTASKAVRNFLIPCRLEYWSQQQDGRSGRLTRSLPTTQYARELDSQGKPFTEDLELTETLEENRKRIEEGTLDVDPVIVEYSKRQAAVLMKEHETLQAGRKLRPRQRAAGRAESLNRSFMIIPTSASTPVARRSKSSPAPKVREAFARVTSSRGEPFGRGGHASRPSELELTPTPQELTLSGDDEETEHEEQSLRVEPSPPPSLSGQGTSEQPVPQSEIDTQDPNQSTPSEITTIPDTQPGEHPDSQSLAGLTQVPRRETSQDGQPFFLSEGTQQTEQAATEGGNPMEAQFEAMADSESLQLRLEPSQELTSEPETEPQIATLQDSLLTGSESEEQPSTLQEGVEIMETRESRTGEEAPTSEQSRKRILQVAKKTTSGIKRPRRSPSPPPDPRQYISKERADARDNRNRLEIAQLVKDKIKLSAAEKQLKAQVKEMTRKLDAQRAKPSDEVSAELQIQLEASREEIKRLKTEVEGLEMKNKNSQKTIKRMESETPSKIKELTDRLNERRDKVDQLRVDLQKERKDHDDSLARIERRDVKMSWQKEELAKKEAELITQDDKLEVLRREVVTLKRQAELIPVAGESGDNRVTRLEEALKKATDSCHQETQKVATKDKEIDSLKVEVEQLRNNQAAPRKATTEENELRELRQTIANLSVENTKLSADVTTLKTEKVRLANTNTVCRNQMTALERTVREQKEELKKTEMVPPVEEYDRLRAQVEELQTARNTLQADKESLLLRPDAQGVRRIEEKAGQTAVTRYLEELPVDDKSWARKKEAFERQITENAQAEIEKRTQLFNRNNKALEEETNKRRQLQADLDKASTKAQETIEKLEDKHRQEINDILNDVSGLNTSIAAGGDKGQASQVEDLTTQLAVSQKKVKELETEKAKKGPSIETLDLRKELMSKTEQRNKAGEEAERFKKQCEELRDKIKEKKNALNELTLQWNDLVDRFEKLRETNRNKRESIKKLTKKVNDLLADTEGSRPATEEEASERGSGSDGNEQVMQQEAEFGPLTQLDKDTIREEKQSNLAERRRCPNCFKIFDSIKDMIDHFQLSHPEGDKCPVCEEPTKDPKHTDVHMRKHQKFTCSFVDCGEVRHTKHDLKMHLKTHGAATHRCTHGCENKWFSTAKTLKQHYKRIHDPETENQRVPMRCLWCHTVFNRFTSLVEHNRLKHRGDELKFVNEAHFQDIHCDEQELRQDVEWEGHHY
jgi:hypothetical protein